MRKKKIAIIFMASIMLLGFLPSIINANGHIEEEPLIQEIIDDSEIEKIDFSSKRLLVLNESKTIFRDSDEVVSSFNDLHLLRYNSEEETKEAYVYFKTCAKAVEVDKIFYVAESNDIEEIPQDLDPLTELQEQLSKDETRPFKLSEKLPVIALIDTGSPSHENVIDRVTLVGESVEDEHGHGTKMVGFITEEDPSANILSIKCMEADGKGALSVLISSVEYAIERDVDIINLSLAAKDEEVGDVFKNTLLRALEQGIIVNGAAGNDGTDVAGYTPGNIDEIIVLGSATPLGERRASSNFGDTVDYNVVANSTSEATARMSGILSNNNLSLSYINSILNKGKVYEPDYVYTQEENDYKVVVRFVDERGNKIRDNLVFYRNGDIDIEKEVETETSFIAKGLADEGYEVINSVQRSKQEATEIDSEADAVVDIILRKTSGGPQDDMQLELKKTRTIHYEFENKDKAFDDVVQEVLFTRTAKQSDSGEIAYSEYKTEDNTWKEVNSPTLRGYTPSKAKVNAKEVTVDTENTVETITYRIMNYTITYILDGGKNSASNPSSYTVNDTIKLSNPTKDGHTFVRWKEGDTINKNSVGNKTFTAEWEKNDVVIPTPTTTPTPTPVITPTPSPTTSPVVTPTPTPSTTPNTNNENISEVPSATPNTTNNNQQTGNNTTNNNQNTAQSYSITYILNGGTNHKDNPSTYTSNDSITLKDPTRSDYQFLGWKEGKTIPKGSTGNKTFTAEWEYKAFSVANSNSTTTATTGKTPVVNTAEVGKNPYIYMFSVLLGMIMAILASVNRVKALRK